MTIEVTYNVSDVYIDYAINDIYVDVSYASASGGSSSWGGITGTLSAQTDLQAALDAKEGAITSGTTSQYFRGDKTFQTLDKTAVGLGNIDNTSDVNKPVSTAQATAISAKQDTLVSGTNIQTINGASILGSGNAVVSDFINVKQYGAVGDGSTDDSKAIALAWGAARTAGKDLFFPGGTYLLNSFWNKDGTANTTSNVFFDLGNGNPPNWRNIRIFGEKKTRLTSALSANGGIGGVIYFRCQYNMQDVVFENIFFESTHAITTNQVVAIQYSAGSAGNTIYNPKVTNCVFEGFSPSIQLNGTVNAVIANNIFNAPKGREQAQNNTNPACFITMSSNDQAQVINPIITGNIANGYSNTAAITTMIQRQLMDNFVQGDCVGGIISNNYTKNLGTEHIIVAGYNGTGQTNAPLLITGNVLDCTIPSGTYRYQSTTPLTNTVGIRADKMNVTVSNNIIYNASWGILLYGADYSTIQYKNTIIDSNTLFMHNDSSNTDIVISTGIQLQGYNSGGVNLLNGVISNNRIVFSGSTLRGTTQAIMVNDANPVTVKDNTVNISSITTGGNSIYYLSATRATVDMRRNMCNGVGSLTAWTSNTSSTINRFDLVLTTTGTSGPATITGDTLNIPQYSGGSSGITRSVNNVSTNTTAAAAANTDYVYNCTSALNLTLPTAVSNTNRYSVKNDSSGTVNVIFTSGQNADGSTTIAMIPNQALDFISDGTNYNIY